MARLLLPVDVEVIKRIRLYVYNDHDRCVCPYTRDMNYSVKSGYWTATHDFYEDDAIVQPS